MARGWQVTRGRVCVSRLDDADLVSTKHAIARLSKSALTGTRAQRWAVHNPIRGVGLPSLLKYAAYKRKSSTDRKVALGSIAGMNRWPANGGQG